MEPSLSSVKLVTSALLEQCILANTPALVVNITKREDNTPVPMNVLRAHTALSDLLVLTSVLKATSVKPKPLTTSLLLV
jgi:hypothetical protein